MILVIVFRFRVGFGDGIQEFQECSPTRFRAGCGGWDVDGGESLENRSKRSVEVGP
jgi:hypothetical protein